MLAVVRCRSLSALAAHTYDCSDRSTERVSLKSESTSAAVPEGETIAN